MTQETEREGRPQGKCVVLKEHLKRGGTLGGSLRKLCPKKLEELCQHRVK